MTSLIDCLEQLVLSELFDLSIVGPAFVAGLIVLSTHVPLGQEVLKRGIIFIDLAIAQVAGLGVIAAHAMDWDPNGLEVQIAAVSAALAAAIGLNWTEKRWPQIQESLIGILFILAATGGILLLSGNPHGSEHLKELLVGQILWQTYSSLLPLALLYAVVLLFWFTMRERFGPLMFYLVFAIVVYFVGIVISFYMDLPTGAVIVWSMALIAVVVGFVVSDKRTED
jgi:zinc/manganese transport system permease protein